MDNQQFFSKPSFELWLKKASPPVQDWFQAEVNYLKSKIEPGARILDVGCGFGRHMALLAPAAQEVVGIDHNPDMIRKAQKQLSEFGNVKLLHQDAQNTGLPNDYFDWVICMTNTFGNFVDKKLTILREMKRVCKEEGKIIVSVFSDKALGLRKRDYQEKEGLHITNVENWVIYTQEGLVSEGFSKSQLKTLAQFIGLALKVKELADVGYLAEFSKGFVACEADRFGK